MAVLHLAADDRLAALEYPAGALGEKAHPVLGIHKGQIHRQGPENPQELIELRLPVGKTRDSPPCRPRHLARFGALGRLITLSGSTRHQPYSGDCCQISPHSSSVRV